MKYLLLLTIGFLDFQLDAQIVTATLGATTQIIQSNTNISIGGGGGNKSYLVCPGITLSYAESSTMDTIYLETGSSLKIDSTFSYGYSTIYAKAGSMVDINFRQVGKLIFENGVSVLDTNLSMPSSFFMGSVQASSVVYNYSNLPGGIGCAPSSVSNMPSNANLISCFTNHDQLILHGHLNEVSRIKIFNVLGQALKDLQTPNLQSIDISELTSGIFWVQITDKHNQVYTKSFVK
ncbi:MAG: T9SS type A sorting domain-containing protein [Bacteroidetes bacterium]|nr:T9SS type A sorting domain-containing protein [Bacteroidota bacterium]